MLGSLRYNKLLELPRMTRKTALAALILAPSFSFAATVLSAPPELNNKSYVLMDYETGQILARLTAIAHRGPERQYPPQGDLLLCLADRSAGRRRVHARRPGSRFPSQRRKDQGRQGQRRH